MYLDKIRGTKVGDKLLFPKVLLLGNAQETVVGRPWVPGASVLAAVEQQTRDAKQHVFKMKRRKGYRKFEGFRTVRHNPAPRHRYRLSPLWFQVEARCKQGR